MVFPRKGFPRKNLCLVFDLDLHYLLTIGIRDRHEIEKIIRLGFHPIHRAAARIIFGSVFFPCRVQSAIRRYCIESKAESDSSEFELEVEAVVCSCCDLRSTKSGPPPLCRGRSGLLLLPLFSGGKSICRRVLLVPAFGRDLLLLLSTAAAVYSGQEN